MHDGRSATASAHMQAPGTEEVRRRPRVMLAYMQTSESNHSRRRSDEEFAHMRTPFGQTVRATSDSTAAYMQPSEECQKATAADIVPAYMRSSEQEHGVISVAAISTKEIMATIASYFAPGELFPVSELLETVREAQEIADTNYGVVEAVEWAEGYEFPKEMLAKDLLSFEDANWDFSAMVKRRLEAL